MIVEELITKYKANPETLCTGTSPLHAAALYGHEKCCEKLFAYFKNYVVPVSSNGSFITVSKPSLPNYINKKQSKGSTALHLAASRGHVACVEILLKHDADVTICDATGKTALHLASINGHANVIRALLSPLNGRTKLALLEMLDRSGRTSLHYAVEKNQLKAAEELIKLGANVNCKDPDGTRPLHIACKGGYLQMLYVLLQEDIILLDSPDNNNISPLEMALTEKQFPCAKLLVERGCSIKGNLPNLDLKKEAKIEDTNKGLIDLLNAKISKTGIVSKKSKQRYLVLEISIIKQLNKEEEIKKDQSGPPKKDKKGNRNHPNQESTEYIYPLKIYENPKMEKLKASIDLWKYKISHSPDTEVFSLEPHDNRDRPYTFKAFSKEEAEEWANALNFYTKKKKSEKHFILHRDLNRVNNSLSLLALKHESENEFSIEKNPERRFQITSSVEELPILPLTKVLNLPSLQSIEEDSGELQVVADYFAAKSVSTYPVHPETRVPQGLPICDRFFFSSIEKETYVALADGCG